MNKNWEIRIDREYQHAILRLGATIGQVQEHHVSYGGNLCRYVNKASGTGSTGFSAQINGVSVLPKNPSYTGEGTTFPTMEEAQTAVENELKTIAKNILQALS